jgi:hypothetical protein
MLAIVGYAKLVFLDRQAPFLSIGSLPSMGTERTSDPMLSITMDLPNDGLIF